MALPDPVIVVPGITANYLHDTYPLPPEEIWTVLNLNYARAALHPQDLRYEVGPPSLVRPGQLYEIAYKELINELRHNLTESPLTPVPVFPFSYDWRQRLETTEPQLKAFIDEVIDRTSLLSHYAQAGYRDNPKVALVGHSMGGLVIAGYLQRYGTESRVSKVATLATPYRGSFEAVIKVTTGTANLGTSAPSSREREAARLTPALYNLMPDVPNGIVVPPDLPRSLFDPAVWQPSIVQTIAQYIRLHSDSANPDADARALFADLLNTAEAHRRRIGAFRLDAAGLSPADWLCIIGVDAVTRVRLEIVRGADGTPDFRFRGDDRANQWGNPDPAQAEFTGDGTVPFEGAVPAFLPRESLVCVTPDDFGYWEIQDKLTTQIAGFHGILPNMDMLHRMIVRFFTNAPDRHDNTWGRPAPGVAAWAPPLPLKNKAGG